MMTSLKLYILNNLNAGVTHSLRHALLSTIQIAKKYDNYGRSFTGIYTRGQFS